jgi:hypothetical protein
MDDSGRLQHLFPAGTISVAVPARAFDRARAVDELRRLPRGTTVALADHRFGSRRRCRDLARRASIDVERELLAIPSIEAPDFVVDDVAPAVSAFWRAFVTVPPGVSTPALPMTVAIRIVALLRAWVFIGAVVPGRFTIGRRA